MMLSACDDVDDVGISLSKYCRYIFVEIETMITSSDILTGVAEVGIFVGISLSKYCRYIFVELETMIMASKIMTES